MNKIFLVLILFFTGNLAFSQQWEKIPKTEKTTGIFFLNENTGWRVERSFTLYKTADGGKTWYKKIQEGSALADDNTPPPKGVYEYTYGSCISSLFFLNEVTGWTGLTGFRGGVLTTTDGGNSWNDHLKSNENTDEANGEPYFLSALNIFFENYKTGWACGRATGKGKTGFYKSVDGGISWRNVPVNIFYDPAIIYDEETEHLHYVPDEPDLDKIFFADSLTGWVIGNRLFIYTKNGGRSWARDTSRQYQDLRDIFFLDKNNGWIAEGGQLLRTKDGGKSYETIYEDTSYLPITSILFLDNDHGFIAASKDPWLEMDGSLIEEGKGYLLETIDGGKNWKIILKENCAFYDLQMVNDSTVFTASRSGIYKLNVKK